MPFKGGRGSVLRCVTYMVVIFGFILAERTVSLNKKCYQAYMEIKKKMPKAWVLAEDDSSASSGPMCRPSCLYSI